MIFAMLLVLDLVFDFMLDRMHPVAHGAVSRFGQPTM